MSKWVCLETKEAIDVADHIPHHSKIYNRLVKHPAPRMDFVFQGVYLTQYELDWIASHRIHLIPSQWGFREPPLLAPSYTEDFDLFRRCGFQGYPLGVSQACLSTHWTDIELDMMRLFPLGGAGFSQLARSALKLFHYSLMHTHIPLAQIFDPSDVTTHIRRTFEKASVDLESPPPRALRRLIDHFHPLVTDTTELHHMSSVFHQLIFDSPERAVQFLKAREMLVESEWRPRSVPFFTILVAMDTLVRLAVPGVHGSAVIQWAHFVEVLESYMEQRENALDDEPDYWDIDVSDPLHPQVVVVEADTRSPSSISASSDAYSSTYSPSQTNTMDQSP